MNNIEQDVIIKQNHVTKFYIFFLFKFKELLNNNNKNNEFY